MTDVGPVAVWEKKTAERDDNTNLWQKATIPDHRQSP